MKHLLKIRTSGNRTSGDRTSGGPPVCTLGDVKSLVSRAESGQLQFWSEPSEILNLRSSNTPKTVAFAIP